MESHAFALQPTLIIAKLPSSLAQTVCVPGETKLLAFRAEIVPWRGSEPLESSARRQLQRKEWNLWQLVKISAHLQAVPHHTRLRSFLAHQDCGQTCPGAQHPSREAGAGELRMGCSSVRSPPRAQQRTHPAPALLTPLPVSSLQRPQRAGLVIY